MTTLDESAKYQRFLKTLPYSEQVDQERRMSLLRNVQRRRYLEEKEQRERQEQVQKKEGFVSKLLSKVGIKAYKRKKYSKCGMPVPTTVKELLDIK